MVDLDFDVDYSTWTCVINKSSDYRRSRMTKAEKTDIFNVIINIMIILLTIFVVYSLIKLIFGGSPGFSEVNFALIILIGGILFKVYGEIGEIKVDTKHISVGVRESFNKIKDDITLIKKRLKIKEI